MTPSHKNPCLCDASKGQLVVIDIQGRLAAVMDTADRERVINNAGILIQAANLLAVPVISTEQYPRGLGPTEEGVTRFLPDSHSAVEKSCFACTSNKRFNETLTINDREQVILTGMEAHICVLQTALEMTASGYSVFVVEDGVCSRKSANYQNALERMRAAGVVITNTESVIFEWLRDASHEHFKAISSLIK